jgi:hypothetical protein
LARKAFVIGGGLRANPIIVSIAALALFYGVFRSLMHNATANTVPGAGHELIRGNLPVCSWIVISDEAQCQITSCITSGIPGGRAHICGNRARQRKPLRDSLGLEAARLPLQSSIIRAHSPQSSP